MSNSRGHGSTNRGYKRVVEPIRVCKSHEVVLEEMEWANTGHEVSACRGHESTCKDMGVLAEAVRA